MGKGKRVNNPKSEVKPRLEPNGQAPPPSFEAIDKVQPYVEPSNDTSTDQKASNDSIFKVETSEESSTRDELELGNIQEKQMTLPKIIVNEPIIYQVFKVHSTLKVVSYLSIS